VRILGELKKLGIGGVSRSTVVNILKQAGLPTGPARGERTWDQFLKAHAKTLWACDFVTMRVLTSKGLRFAFALVFVHPKTRRAHVSTSTINPEGAWFTEVVRRFAASLPTGMAKPRLLLHDRDSKFAAGDAAFGRALAGGGISVGYRSRNRYVVACAAPSEITSPVARGVPTPCADTCFPFTKVPQVLPRSTTRYWGHPFLTTRTTAA